MLIEKMPVHSESKGTAAAKSSSTAAAGSQKAQGPPLPEANSKLREASCQNEENKSPNICTSPAQFQAALKLKPVEAGIEEEAKGDNSLILSEQGSMAANSSREVLRTENSAGSFAKMQSKWKRNAQQTRENLVRRQNSQSQSPAPSLDNSLDQLSHSVKIVSLKREDQSSSRLKKQGPLNASLGRQGASLTVSNKKRSQTFKRPNAALKEDAAQVSPNDVQITLKKETTMEDEGQQWEDDPLGKSLKDMKALFDSKISTNWSRSKRQEYDAVQCWAQKSSLNHLAEVGNNAATPSSELYRVVVSIPSTYQFVFQARAESSIMDSAIRRKQAQVSLMLSATLFHQESGNFIGRTCVPKGSLMTPKSGNLYSLKSDCFFELYFFAEACAKYSLVLDFYMEQSSQEYEAKQLQSIGWLFTPIHSLPAQQATNLAQGLAPPQKVALLKGSARMLLDPTKEKFEPCTQGYTVRVDSEKVGPKLQSNLQELKRLIPVAALFSDADQVPGVHCPLDDSNLDWTKNSQVVFSMRRQQNFKVTLKEQRNAHLIRMRVHYLNINEKALLKQLQQTFELATGLADLDLSISQRLLNVRLHNTWVNLGPAQSIGLGAPVKQGSKRQVMEACANLKLGRVLADPMICLLFDFVVEVKVESRDRVMKESVTLATLPYMPKFSRTSLQPVSLIDDFIIESVPVSKAKKLNLPSGQLMQVLQGQSRAQICIEGIISENEQICQQVEIREQERLYQTQLDKMRRNRRRELERMGIQRAKNSRPLLAIDSSEDAAIVKVKIEQQKLLEELDMVRARQVKYMQESEMLKFQSSDTSGMNYFDAIKRVIREGTIEVNSLKCQYRQNLKTLKALEKAQAQKGELCAYEDSDEEFQRLCKESKDARVTQFQPVISFQSRAMSLGEANQLASRAGLSQIDLTEPIEEGTILLHNEASDSCRLNQLIFHVVKIDLDRKLLPLEDLLMELEIEELNLAPNTQLSLNLSFGSLGRITVPVRLTADSFLEQTASIEYDDIDCQRNKDLADYFKMFYSGTVQVTLNKPGGPVFALSHVEIKQCLRQRKQQRLTAFEAKVYDSVKFKAVGSIQLVVDHRGKFVNPSILSCLNSENKMRTKVKKVKARDPEWLKIGDREDFDSIAVDKPRPKAANNDEITAEATQAAAAVDERKLRRIAAYKSRQNKAIHQRSTMRLEAQKVCTHSRSRSGSRESSPASSMSRPMSASLVNAVRERCIQPQVVHMTEQEFIAQKRKTFKPAVLLSKADSAQPRQHDLDMRAGEPTFFYVLLENPNENLRNRRTYTISVAGDKVSNYVKLLTNFEEVNYWRTYGRLEDMVTIDGRTVRLITPEDVVDTCILLNEVRLNGLQAVAVPFMLRSYKRTEFEKERLVVNASYTETSFQKRTAANPVEFKEKAHEEFHRFTVTERFQPKIHLKAFEACLVRDKNQRQASLVLIPDFESFFREKLRPHYLGDVSTYASRLHFKSNLGRVWLEGNYESLLFDPAEVGEPPVRSLDLNVYMYTMANKSQVSLSNPFELGQVFHFSLNLVEVQTWAKIEEKLKPEKRKLVEEIEVPDVVPIIGSSVGESSPQHSQADASGNVEAQTDQMLATNSNKHSQESKSAIQSKVASQDRQAVDASAEIRQIKKSPLVIKEVPVEKTELSFVAATKDIAAKGLSDPPKLKNQAAKKTEEQKRAASSIEEVKIYSDKKADNECSGPKQSEAVQNSVEQTKSTHPTQEENKSVVALHKLDTTQTSELAKPGVAETKTSQDKLKSDQTGSAKNEAVKLDVATAEANKADTSALGAKAINLSTIDTETANLVAAKPVQKESKSDPTEGRQSREQPAKVIDATLKVQTISSSLGQAAALTKVAAPAKAASQPADSTRNASSELKAAATQKEPEEQKEGQETPQEQVAVALAQAPVLANSSSKADANKSEAEQSASATQVESKSANSNSAKKLTGLAKLRQNIRQAKK